MEDSFGCMFKLTGSNYSVWKSNMRDMLVCKDLWLPMQRSLVDKTDVSTWEVMHLNAEAYIRCLIDIRRQMLKFRGRRSGSCSITRTS